MNIVLVRQGTKFSPKYVEVLIKSCEEFAGVTPITLTDQDDTPGLTSKMKSDYTGFWSKLELFAPWQRHLRPCLFLDLDTLVLKNIQSLLAPTEDLWLIRDFYNPDRSNSGVMILPKDTNRIWANSHLWSTDKADGNFLNTQPHKVIQDYYFGIKSYKADADHEDARICCFHGRPKPHDAEDEWVKKTWQ